MNDKNATQITPAPHYRVIGHRGIAGLAPENTYTSFRKAAEIGLNWVEFDVQLTKCGTWIIMHDETLDRTTTGKGNVCDHTYQELSQLEAGLWFTPPFKNEKIPTLHNTLELCLEIGLQTNIEVKGSESDPDKHVAAFVKFMSEKRPNIYPLPLISSFDLSFLILLRQQEKHLPIGYLIEAFEPDSFEIFEKHTFTTIHCDATTLRDTDLEQAVKLNIPVLLYTINEPKQAEPWLEKGVNAVFSDRPDLFIPNLST
jgi:glycerophosphoryl diester phosphodiesterase